MKLVPKTFYLFSVFTVTLFLVVTSTEIKSKRSQSMMEYLNSYFAEPEQPAKVTHINKKRENFKFKQVNAVADASSAAPSTNSTSGNSTDSSQMLSDWWEISSPSFRDAKKFPPILMPDGSEAAIECDDNFFRINSAFAHSNGNSKPPTNKSFWFRLQGTVMYYSSIPKEMNILDDVTVKTVQTIAPSTAEANTKDPKYCLKLVEVNSDNWLICTSKKETAKTWACHIKKALKIDDDECNSSSDAQVNNVKVIEKKVTQPIIVMPSPSRKCNEGWNYQSNGDDWECECKGNEQSPIDLPLPTQAVASPVKPYFSYDEVKSSEKKPIKMTLENNMLKIKYDRFGKLVTVDGTVYYAQEIQIHTPSEHTIDGRTFDMEIQILHAGVSKGDLAKSAMLCFLIEKVPGVYNKFIDDLDFFNLPNLINQEKKIDAGLFIPKIFYSADEEVSGGLRPFSFFTYQGSLTSPPCLEETVVFVAATPIQLGSTAIKLFQEALRVPDTTDADGEVIAPTSLPISNRSPQPLNGRPVFYYNHQLYCGPEPKKRLENPGHYEKVKKPATEYYFVHGKEHSGFPGSIVVPESEALGKKTQLNE